MAANGMVNFERHFDGLVRPSEGKFTRADLNALPARMRDRRVQSRPLKGAA
jgi:hypothetical protein